MGILRLLTAVLAVFIVSLQPGTFASASDSRSLTIDERVRAQEAIERVYYSHQLAATQPFDRAVPAGLLRSKVERSLKLSVALDRFWNVPVTAAALARESERIATATRLPDRLAELYAALGNDPFVFQETVARQSLVERLARRFYARDERLHAAARTEAERLRESLARGFIDARSSHPHRREVESAGEELARRLSLKLPMAVGPIVEEPDCFRIGVLLDEFSPAGRAAVYTVAKRSWDEWWSAIEPTLDASAAESVSAPMTVDLPAPRRFPGTTGEGPSAILAGECAADDTWPDTSMEVPEGRAYPVSVWTGTLMIVWSGYRNGWENTGSRYDPATDSWMATSLVVAPAGRQNPVSVWTGTEMIVWGGAGAGGNLVSGGRYNPISDTWTPTSLVNVPTSRFNSTAVWTGSLMLVWGGYGSGVYRRDGGRYDPLSDTWTPMSQSFIPTPRERHTAVWTGSRMIVWGGENNQFTGRFNTGSRYDPVGDAWSAISTANAPTARTMHTAVWTGSKMIVWGGSTDLGDTDTGGLYDPVANAWVATSATGAPTPRTAHSMVWSGTRMLVWGGGGWEGLVNTGGAYDPLANLWVAMSTTNAPVARQDHAAVWAETQMIVWGGFDAFDYTYFNSGGRYKPDLDTWTPTAPQDAPSPRSGHAAVWTGTLMVIWGGGDDVAMVDTGGRFDPLTGNWTPTATSGAPTPRSGPTGAWTGDRMVVWGGYDPATASFPTAGGRYDPISDSWSPTQSAGAPAGRYLFTGVWTGSRLLVWGGTGQSLYLGDGGSYDPAADSWTAIATAGAPPPRYWHSAVWTGSEMIVWGGEGGGDNGGRYDPASDSWKSVSQIAAPPWRADHTAVWAGSRMIVWGGSPYTNSGGLYDPASDSWAPTAIDANTPAGRAGQRAIWTGHQMIVWGGLGGGNFLGDGARYDPLTDTWMPMSGSGAPAGRRNFSMKWTGSEMILFGGFDGAYLGTGGVYDPGSSVRDDDGDGYTECTGLMRDCSDLDGSAFAVPLDVEGLTVTAPSALAWTSCVPASGSGTVHDVLRGMLGSMPVGSGAEVCLAPGIPGSNLEDPSNPAAGSGFWYLVRARNACGTGTWGATSGGVPRSSNACP